MLPLMLVKILSLNIRYKVQHTGAE